MKNRFISNCESAKDLHKNFLLQIRDVKFTAREVDVISCIIHNRGEKKIAILLDISPKTVSAHVYNILNKLGCNSKDQIIDFVENAGQSGHFREYYLHLLIKMHFEKFLRHVAENLNKSGIKIAYKNKDKLANERIFIEIEKSFNMANISLEPVRDNATTDLEMFEPQKISMDNYYLDFVEYILSLFSQEESKKDIINGIKNTFLAGYNNVQDAYLGKVVVEVQGKTSSNQPHYIKFIIFLSTIVIIALACNSYLLFGSNDKQPYDRGQDIVQSLENLLAELNNQDFSANNTSKEGLQRNNSLFKKVERVAEYANDDDVKRYFSNAEMTSESLNIYLYNLHALAAYYLRNFQDGDKAYQVLMHAKNLAEGYVASRSGSMANFDDMLPNEVLSELSIIHELPEIYTRIIYMMGRTYFYSKDINAQISKKYFNLSKYLAGKLDLYEFYISNTSGLFRLWKDEATEMIEHDKIYEASCIFEKVIEELSWLMASNREYILDFKPNSSESVKIIPSEAPYNIIESIEIRVNILSKLLSIHTDIKDRKKYLSKIEKIFTEIDENIPELLNQISSRKIAVFYNSLGSMFASLIDSGLENENLLQIAKIKLDVQSNNTFDVAEELFNKARDLSRSNDFTKADSYNGLAKLYAKRIKQLRRIRSDFAEAEIKKLNFEIKELKNKRDQINEFLDRKLPH